MLHYSFILFIYIIHLYYSFKLFIYIIHLYYSFILFIYIIHTERIHYSTVPLSVSADTM